MKIKGNTTIGGGAVGRRMGRTVREVMTQEKSSLVTCNRYLIEMGGRRVIVFRRGMEYFFGGWKVDMFADVGSG